VATCEHKVGETVCGKDAVAAVKIKQGRLHQEAFHPTRDMGWGIGSSYLPVCQEHIAAYPDHEGFDLRAGA